MATAVFAVTVTSLAGQPLSGVALRLVDSAGTDVTAARFGQSPVYCDAAGRFAKSYAGSDAELVAAGLPVGNYQILASKAGYAPAGSPTGGQFQGYGTFSVAMLPAGGLAPGDPASAETVVTGTDLPYKSPMVPAEFTVQGVAGGALWELIEATVTDAQGNASSLEVDVVAGTATLNLQARFGLEPIPQLVADGQGVAIDAYFSKKYNIALASITPSGRLALTNQFSVWAANAYPLNGEPTLIDYTNFGDAPAEWLTPWADSELPKFLGHYADAMIWLPYPATDYALSVTYQTINKTTLNTVVPPLPTSLVGSGLVLRLRIPEPVAGAHYAVLTVITTGANEVQSKPLTVRYLNG